MITNAKYVHDRLDLKQHSEEFTSPLCGSLNRVTGVADYCSFDCPVLREVILAGKSASEVQVRTAPPAPSEDPSAHE